MHLLLLVRNVFYFFDFSLIICPVADIMAIFYVSLNLRLVIFSFVA
jgi:hypothetical protein